MIRPVIRRFARMSVIAGMIAFASHGHAAAGAVTPAFAACSKALIETLSKAAPQASFKVKAPRQIVSDMVDPNAFTVIARSAKTRETLAKASCKATPSGEILSFRTFSTKSS